MSFPHVLYQDFGLSAARLLSSGKAMLDSGSGTDLIRAILSRGEDSLMLARITSQRILDLTPKTGFQHHHGALVYSTVILGSGALNSILIITVE